jgi:hypothetical protein
VHPKSPGTRVRLRLRLGTARPPYKDDTFGDEDHNLLSREDAKTCWTMHIITAGAARDHGKKTDLRR